jgi:hypothetical protein
VSVDLHGAEFAGDAPLLIDDEGGPEGALGDPSIELLLAPGAEEAVDGAVLVGEQREGEPLLELETPVRHAGVAAHAHDEGPAGGEGGEVLLECAGLAGTARGAVFRVKIQDHHLPPVILEVEGRAVVGLEREIRGERASVGPGGGGGLGGGLAGSRNRRPGRRGRGLLGRFRGWHCGMDRASWAPDEVSLCRLIFPLAR